MVRVRVSKLLSDVSGIKIVRVRVRFKVTLGDRHIPVLHTPGESLTLAEYAAIFLLFLLYPREWRLDRANARLGATTGARLGARLRARLRSRRRARATYPARLIDLDDGLE